MRYTDTRRAMMYAESRRLQRHRGHRRRRRRSRLTPILFCAVILILGAYFLNSSNSTSVPSETRFSALPAMHLYEFPTFDTLIRTADIADTQYLTLVNRELAVTTPINNSNFVTVWPDMPARDRYVTLHETAFFAVREFLDAAARAGHDGLFIASGYRSYSQQAVLFQNAENQNYVLPPGHSEHHLGLAVDILTSNNNFQSIRGTQEAQWLAENAPRFGLILRYPADKTDITGIHYEPWHFRYVGRVHAWYMSEHGFVLEEYIRHLQEQGGFRAEFDGRTYYVLYQRPENDMIFISENFDFRVSTTNTGGYIVTAWR